MALDPSNSLGLDSRSLDGLRGEAARNPKAAARTAAVQFETLFMQMVLKSMRDATPKAEGDNSGKDTFTSMLDTQMARQFAGRPHGLADMIEQQLTRHMQNLPPVSAQNQVSTVSMAGQAWGAGAAQPAVAAGAASPLGAAGASPQMAFVERLMPHARAAERETGVPASYILGQAALESGWGKSEMRHADGSPSFNLFGIKATGGWRGGTVDARTTEFENGEAVKQVARFRSYGSYTEAFADYARLLANSPRYGQALRAADSPEGFAGGLQRAGYATDPDYASKLTRTIHHTLSLQRAAERG